MYIPMNMVLSMAGQIASAKNGLHSRNYVFVYLRYVSCVEGKRIVNSALWSSVDHLAKAKAEAVKKSFSFCLLDSPIWISNRRAEIL